MSKGSKKKPRRRTMKEIREGQTPEAIGQRIRERHEQHQLEQRAARLAADERRLEAETEEAKVKGSRQAKRAAEIKRMKLQERTLRLLERDDDLVRQVLQRDRKLSAIMDAQQPTDMDEMLWYLTEELKLKAVLEELRPPAERVDEETGEVIKTRTNYSPLVLNLLSLMSRYMGLESNPEIEAAVLTDQRWMSLLGFNASEVENGACRRSESLKGKTRKGQGGSFEEADEAGPVRRRRQGPRGALSFQTVESHESSLEPDKLADVFNAMVRALAEKGYFEGPLRVVLDSTPAEMVPTFGDSGVVSKKVKVKSKSRRPKEVEVAVRGFKVWILMEVATGLPLAMTVDNIEVAETTPAKAIFDQARQNLEGFEIIGSAAVDRGYMDGDLLWWLKKERNIDWVCAAKSKMKVTAEARRRVTAAIEVLAKKGEDELTTAQRAARLGLSHDGVTFFSRRASRTNKRKPLVIANVDDLLETDFYGPGGTKSSRLNSKHFRPTAVYGTVVLCWPDRRKEDVADEKSHDEKTNGGSGPVVLLSPIEEKGFGRFDRYDERSLIENQVNREGKQHFGLGQTLARNRSAFWSATVFSLLALMLYRALNEHREEMAEIAEMREEKLGVLRYRREQMIKNRGRIIVVVRDCYSIMHWTEFAELVGVGFL